MFFVFRSKRREKLQYSRHEQDGRGTVHTGRAVLGLQRDRFGVVLLDAATVYDSDRRQRRRAAVQRRGRMLVGHRVDRVDGERRTGDGRGGRGRGVPACQRGRVVEPHARGAGAWRGRGPAIASRRGRDVRGRGRDHGGRPVGGCSHGAAGSIYGGRRAAAVRAGRVRSGGRRVHSGERVRCGRKRVS